MPGSHQHRLFTQERALLATRKHAVADLARLPLLVETKNELRPSIAGSLGGQAAREGPRGLGRDFVAGVEERLRRAVVALELDHRRVGIERRKVEDVRRGRGAEAV